jgi:hypothetical protein
VKDRERTGPQRAQSGERAPIVFDFRQTRGLEAPPSFLEAAAQLGIEFEPGDVEKLGRFLAMLLEANEKALNLTAITEPGAAWEKHILD